MGGGGGRSTILQCAVMSGNSLEHIAFTYNKRVDLPLVVSAEPYIKHKCSFQVIFVSILICFPSQIFPEMCHITTFYLIVFLYIDYKN